ncbi:hypothetical protein H0H81_003198, partial [Sphagnurus paluster]
SQHLRGPVEQQPQVGPARTSLTRCPDTKSPPPDAATPPHNDDLSVGAAWFFASKLFIDYFINFVFMHLLYTSEAAWYGSCAGIGLNVSSIAQCMPASTTTKPLPVRAHVPVHLSSTELIPNQ